MDGERPETQSTEHDESFEQLAAAYTLGSIEPEDTARLRPHLAACPRCSRLMAEYRAVVENLALSLDEVTATPALKSRLLAEAGRTLDKTPASPRLRVPPPQADPRVSASPRLRVLPARLAYALPLAALILVSFGLGRWNFALREQLAEQQTQLVQQERFIAAGASRGQRAVLAGTQAAPGATGEVVQPADGAPLLAVQGLPRLPANQVYQVWVIAGGQPASAGLMAGDLAQTIIPLERGLSGAQQLALTIEPAGGRSTPSGPIVLAGNI
jgi:anti-sigma factor RsiW